MVIDAISQHVHSPRKSEKLSDRNFGIGSDQMLIVEPPGDLTPISGTGSLMRMVARCRIAATVRVVLPGSSVKTG